MHSMRRMQLIHDTDAIGWKNVPILRLTPPLMFMGVGGSLSCWLLNKVFYVCILLKSGAQGAETLF